MLVRFRMYMYRNFSLGYSIPCASYQSKIRGYLQFHGVYLLTYSHPLQVGRDLVGYQTLTAGAAFFVFGTMSLAAYYYIISLGLEIGKSGKEGARRKGPVQ